jgi:Transglutaminase-like domain
MFYSIKIAAQSSFGLSGYWGNVQNETSILNNFESNGSNYSSVKDWGITISYGSEFSNSLASNLYSFSLIKKIGGNTISARYTPGYQKEFVFNNPVSIISDSTNSNQSLNSGFTYKELFGLGYSYKFSDKFSAGFTFRFFNQEFNQDILNSVFKVDTVYIDRTSDDEKINTSLADVGIIYSPTDNLSLSLSSINLLELGASNSGSDDIEPYKLKNDKAALLGISYFPFSSLNFNLLYETTNSFQANFNLKGIIFKEFGIGLSAFHDKYQTPFIAGIIPALTYFNKFFGITISEVKYFVDRNTTASFSGFETTGLHNIINNRYSFDKIVASFSFTLNTLPEKEVELIGVNVIQAIYPTLSENYINQPFAVGKVANLTDKIITVRPECRIEGINKEKIQSPVVKINPHDTLDVPFYTVIPDGYSNNKTEISYADFSVSTVNENPGDQIQRPALVNGINSWDGKVLNLRHFINKDLNFSMTYAKDVISRHKDELDTIAYKLANFYKAKIIFNEFIKKMVYSSDPMASADYVQFPAETIKLKGGDCDDLSVLFSSLLKSIGIQTALIDYKPESGIGHVSVMFNTELSPLQASLITKNDNKYFLRKNSKGEDEVWVAVETTSLTDFNTAWDIGMQKFNNEGINNLGLAKRKVEIVDVY